MAQDLTVYDTNGYKIGKIQNGTNPNAVIFYIAKGAIPEPILANPPKIVIAANNSGAANAAHWLAISIVGAEVEGTTYRVAGQVTGTAPTFKPKGWISQALNIWGGFKSSGNPAPIPGESVVETVTKPIVSVATDIVATATGSTDQVKNEKTAKLALVVGAGAVGFLLLTRKGGR